MSNHFPGPHPNPVAGIEGNKIIEFGRGSGCTLRWIIHQRCQEWVALHTTEICSNVLALFVWLPLRRWLRRFKSLDSLYSVYRFIKWSVTWWDAVRRLYPSISSFLAFYVLHLQRVSGYSWMITDTTISGTVGEIVCFWGRSLGVGWEVLVLVRRALWDDECNWYFRTVRWCVFMCITFPIRTNIGNIVFRNM